MSIQYSSQKALEQFLELTNKLECDLNTFNEEYQNLYQTVPPQDFRQICQQLGLSLNMDP